MIIKLSTLSSTTVPGYITKISQPDSWEKPRSLLPDPFFKEVFPWLLKSNLVHSITLMSATGLFIECILDVIKLSEKCPLFNIWNKGYGHLLSGKGRLCETVCEQRAYLNGLWKFLLWDGWISGVGGFLALRLVNFWKWVCLLIPICVAGLLQANWPTHCLLGAELLSQVVVVQSLSPVQLFVTPWTAAHQASLSITNSRSLLKLMCIESVMPSNNLILCRPLLLLPSIFPSFRVFSKWPSCW